MMFWILLKLPWKLRKISCEIYDAINHKRALEFVFENLKESEPFDEMKILTSLGVAQDKLESTYPKLTNKSIYDKLVESGKISNKNGQ